MIVGLLMEIDLLFVRVVIGDVEQDYESRTGCLTIWELKKVNQSD